MGKKLQSLLFYSEREMPANNGYPEKEDIVKDLNLRVLFQAAAQPVWKKGQEIQQEDEFVFEAMRRIMLVPLESEQQILYRQALVQGAIAHPEMIQKLYEIGRAAGKLLEQNRHGNKERRGQNTGEMLSTYEYLKGLVGHIESVREILDEEKFEEESGWTALRDRLDRELDETFLSRLNAVLDEMEYFCEGGTISFSMGLGAGMKEEKIQLLSLERQGDRRGKWFMRGKKKAASRTMMLRTDDQLHEAKEMEDAAFSFLLSYFREFLKELTSFFGAFEIQLAFYKGCVNLWERGMSFGAYFCYPTVSDREAAEFCFSGLYELGMAILTRALPVSNSVKQEDCWLLVITGANQGGKSTCLRSYGIAQIMMQCGLFVPAHRFHAKLYQNVYTHFTRREDATMSSGRLDEELKRMDGIVKTVTRDSLLLLNESFATTTEKEGSVIATELVSALYEYGITVGMVTHLLQFARDLYQKKPEHALFLSAERKENGERTFRMIKQEPDETSFGLDLYEEIVENADEA